MPELGKLLIVLGLLIATVGVLFTLGGKIPWLGRLPGDIHVERPGFSFSFPVASCLVVSVVVSLLLWFLRR
jgi:Protein of unknown function (DUF2905)